jgi:hypothetical protein
MSTQKYPRFFLAPASGSRKQSLERQSAPVSRLENIASHKPLSDILFAIYERDLFSISNLAPSF